MCWDGSGYIRTKENLNSWRSLWTRSMPQVPNCSYRWRRDSGAPWRWRNRWQCWQRIRHWTRWQNPSLMRNIWRLHLRLCRIVGRTAWRPAPLPKKRSVRSSMHLPRRHVSVRRPAWTASKSMQCMKDIFWISLPLIMLTRELMSTAVLLRINIDLQ